MRNIAELAELKKPGIAPSFMTVGRHTGHHEYHIRSRFYTGFSKEPLVEEGDFIVGFTSIYSKAYSEVIPGVDIVNPNDFKIRTGFKITSMPAVNPPKGTHIISLPDYECPYQLQNEVESKLQNQIISLASNLAEHQEYETQIADFAMRTYSPAPQIWEPVGTDILDKLLASAVMREEYENAAIFRDAIKYNNENALPDLGNTTNINSTPLLPYNGPDSTRNNG